MKPISSVRSGEPFLLLCDVSNESAYAIRFKTSTVHTAKSVTFRNHKQADVQSFLKSSECAD